MSTIRIVFALLLVVSPARAQSPDNPFSASIEANGGVIRVNYVEFATIPDVDGEPARTMHVVNEPVTGRLFVSDMRGPIYVVSYDGQTVSEYVDIDEPRWGVSVEAGGRERGMQNFAFHPQFEEAGTSGYGRFYTWTDSDNTSPAPDFTPTGDEEAHHTVLLEWTAADPTADTYDGRPPRELFRFRQPFGNHNGGFLAFNPLASPGDPDFGLLYIGVADGGSGGDPMNLAQNLANGFGKILRVDPFGSDSSNRAYGIPDDNPFADDADPNTLDEIYAYGLRNPQRVAWDPANGNMYVSDIGQNLVEEVSLVTLGANLGWNTWEGSYRLLSRSGLDLSNPRGDPGVTYPVSEYGQGDPLFGPCCAASGVHVYRETEIPQLTGLVIWGDNPSGEIFYFDADDLPDGGERSVRRILLNHDGRAMTLLDIIREKNREQGREPASRVDLRIASGPQGQILLLNKQDGIVRMLTP